MSNTATVQISSARSDFHFYSTKEIRALLKQNTGYNARQVSVSAKNSDQYVTLTVRDASVDLAKVEAFRDGLHTWNMDVTDYVTGQSLTVETTREVDEALAAPFAAAAGRIPALVATMAPGDVRDLDDVLPGLLLISDRFDVYLSRGDARGTYKRREAVGDDWAARAFALDMARLAR